MGQFSYIGDAALIAKGQHAITQAVTDSAEDLVGKAQEQTPVDTGTLKASIHVESIEHSGNQVKATVATGGEADYAAYVHEGTSKMNGTPFLSNALIENRAAYLEAMARAARGAY